MSINIQFNQKPTSYDANFVWYQNEDQVEADLGQYMYYHGTVWANEETEWKTRVRLDYVEAGLFRIDFGGGPASYEDLGRYVPADEIDGLCYDSIITRLMQRLETYRFEVDFEEQHFYW